MQDPDLPDGVDIDFIRSDLRPRRSLPEDGPPALRRFSRNKGKLRQESLPDDKTVRADALFRE